MAFPALEVVTRSANGPAVGTRIPLTPPSFMIGRARELVLRIPSGLISRHHCELTYEQDRWWLRDNSTTNGTFHLGRRADPRVALEHGDVFDVAGYVCFRLLLREPIEHRDAAMEQAIIDEPADDQRWLVYADWLLERGAPLGERMMHHRASDDLRWLGPLARMAAEGECQITWHRGLPSRAVLRHLNDRAALDHALANLIADPFFRFLRGLELDLSSFDRTPTRASWAMCVLDLIGIDSLPMLESVTIGPGQQGKPSALIAEMLEARRKRHPRFTTTVETLFTSWKRATLVHDGKTHALTGEVTFHVGPRGADLELDPECPSFGLIFHADRWVLTVDRNAKKVVKVNGVPVLSAFLRPGDQIEPQKGVILHFAA